MKREGARPVAERLKKAGYATDPQYAGKIVDLAYGRNISDALAQQDAPTQQSL